MMSTMLEHHCEVVSTLLEYHCEMVCNNEYDAGAPL